MNTIELPKGFVRCESTECLYRLKPHKKKHIPENIEINVGKVLYIFSHYSGGYRKHVITRDDPWIEKLEGFIRMGIVYHRP